MRLAALSLTIPALLGVGGPGASAQGAGSYHVVKRIPVEGNGGWDYLTADGPNHRLYISRGTHVTVLDTEKDAVVGDIPNTEGVHGIALAPRLNKGFVSDGGDNTVTVFDTRTLKVLGKVSVGARPDCIIFDPASNRVFTFNGGGGDSTAIDAATDKVVGTVPLDGRPEYAAADGRGEVFCNIEDKSEICAIDSNTLKVKNTWSIAPGDGPSGLAIDAAHRRLFSVCGNQKMIVLDADTGKVIATPEIGHGPDAAGFDPRAGLAFSSNGEGTLTLVREKDPNTFTVVGSVPTEPGARTMTVDTRTHKIYLCTAKVDPNPAPAGAPRRRRSYVAGSFVVLVVSR